MNDATLQISDQLLAQIMTGLEFGHPPHFFEVIEEPIPDDFEIVRTEVEQPRTVTIHFKTDNRGGPYTPVLRTIYENGDNPKQKAVFPGKFNPPHFGHAVTIVKLMREYDLTVVVTRDVPEGASFTPEQIAEEIRGLGVEVELFDGVLTEQERDPFGGRLILTGNPHVLQWAETRANARYVPRSGIVSGTRLRHC